MNYLINDPDLFKEQAIQWAASFDVACYFDSNSYSDPYSAFDLLIAAGTASEVTGQSGTALNSLQNYLDDTPGYKLGFFCYDLKNEIEDLSSSNPDGLHFPDLFFFEPLHLILVKNGQASIYSPAAEAVLKTILNQEILHKLKDINCQVKSRISKDEYIHAVEDLQRHIHRGDIYEVNFCQEFYCEVKDLDILSIFNKLNQASPAPFASFFKLHGLYILSATPERYLARRGNKLVSQPIKGTVRRGENQQQDELLKKTLFKDPKERAENVMIVDLVRNDLTQCAVPGTVKVEELFGIYSFKQVHQMISTVSCEVTADKKITDIIRATLPMGSMTGAPKISAMKLIEQYEKTRRGIFSGAIGYISAENDFDLNVVIRSMFYNSKNSYLSFQVGSAITSEADAEKEYEECLLKASAMMNVLGQKF